MAMMCIKDPEKEVFIVVYFRAGNRMVVRGKVKHAREALVQWKKYMMFALCADAEKRKTMEDPFVLYHFLEGEEGGEMHAMASLYFGDVCGLEYAEIPEEKADKAMEKYAEAVGKMAEVMKKALDNEQRGETWRNPENPDGENK